MNRAVAILLLAAAALPGLAQSVVDQLAPALQPRQERISRRGVDYLWQRRLDPETGRIGKVQGRYLQALTILALAADGGYDLGQSGAAPEAVQHVLDELLRPIQDVPVGGKGKVFVGTTEGVLAFETHTMVALAYEQLATMDLGNVQLNGRFLDGAEAAVEYLMDFRKRGRTYATAGGWPVNSLPYNRDRPDRRITSLILALLRAHEYNGRTVSSTALKEAPEFVFAAQREPPRRTSAIEQAEKLYEEWSPRMRRGEPVPDDVREPLNDYLEFRRLAGESGGFGLDTLGVVSPTATALGLYVMGLFDFPDATRRAAAAAALLKMPLSWEGQRFFLTQFFAVRGLYFHSMRYGSADFEQYLTRLLTLLEEKQAADGSFPLGSRGVEDLTQMEQVYTTAMCVLVVNVNRGNLVFDRLP